MDRRRFVWARAARWRSPPMHAGRFVFQPLLPLPIWSCGRQGPANREDFQTTASPTWAHDGFRTASGSSSSAREPGHRTRLFLHDLGPGRPAPITPEGVGAWVVSPDGSRIAARGPAPTIQLYALDGSAPRQVPGVTGGEVPVGWITDGLLVMRPGDPASPLGEISRIDIKTGRQDIWKNIMPRDRTGIMGQMSFRVTPDGQSQAYTWHRALSSLYIADGLA